MSLPDSVPGILTWFSGSLNRLACLVVLLVAVLCTATPVLAHFLLNVNIRVIHVLHEDNQIRLLVRLPMPYLVADKLGPEGSDGQPAPAPFTTNKTEAGNLVHYLDAAALRAAPQGLGRILADGMTLASKGVHLKPAVGRVRAYPARKQPPFSLRSEAEAAIAGPVYAPEFSETYVGDTIVDVELIYPTTGPLSQYTLASTLNPELPKQDETANLILDHGPGDPLIFRIRGLLNEPVDISRSALKAVWTFTLEGIRHILEGTDHVLFVFCLILGATTLATLAWRITGFTIGHTITLSLGFFGLVPAAPWFVPLVETGIAASIVYAAVAAIMRWEHKLTLLVTAAIGLLHGLGFSFVLREILKVDAPNLWQSLLAFNVGVEIGQLGIALLVWPVLWLILKNWPSRADTVRLTLAVPCIALAAIWIGERATQVYNLI